MKQQLPPLAFVGRARRRHPRSIDTLQSPGLDFFRRWRRRQVLVEGFGVSSRDVSVGERLHPQLLRAAHRPRDPDVVSRAQQAILFRGLSVDGDFAALARALRFRARLEEARDIEPHVETDVLHGFSM